MRMAGLVLVVGGLLAGGAFGSGPYVNVALGKPVTFQTKPNYWLSKDDDDAKQLTDGKFASKDSFWTDRGACVGWNSGSVAVGSATIDLGEETPITGFSWQFAFGRAGVRFPESINVYVSSDGKTWYFAGALLDRALTLQGTPPPLQYRVWRAHAEDMPCRGRYVRFIGSQKGYVFCDELEVYRGDDSLLKKPHAGVPTDDPLAYRGDSWRAYSQPGTEYCPYFVSPTCVMDAKQSEAIREGVEDYEYLSMLAEKAAAPLVCGESSQNGGKES